MQASTVNAGSCLASAVACGTLVGVADQTTSELPRNSIPFLRDCYEADNREAALFDLRHERVQHLHLLNPGGDFLTGNLDPSSKILTRRSRASGRSTSRRTCWNFKPAPGFTLILTARMAACPSASSRLVSLPRNVNRT